MEPQLPNTRKKAKELRQLYYYTGNPCKNGHYDKRYVKNGGCMSCVADRKPEADKRYRAKNIERLQEYDRNRPARKTDPEKRKAAKKRFYDRHKERILPVMAVYRAENKLARAKYFQEYKKVNAGKVRFWNANREAAQIQRTPKWLSEDDLWMIKEAYELAALRTKLLGVQWHIDHIVPLQGKTVSGLHTPQNIQVILGADNVRKNNKWDPDGHSS